MKVFIAGITGATGRRLAQQLLQRGHTVVAIARSQGLLTKALLEHPELSLKIGSIGDIPDSELVSLLEGCDAIGCCLGHNLSAKGIWGHPRRLVLDIVKRMYRLALEKSNVDKPVRFVLMGSNGVIHPDGQDQNKCADRAVLTALRYILPPHRDNELAAEYLINQNDQKVQWCIVRPVGLIDELEVSPIKVFASAQRGPIFSSDFISRINVAEFMTQLMSNDAVWKEWQGKMPVIYNENSLQ
ncbi:NAD(P)-dependent oxidoreductase [Reinekea sp.]|jgi:nucleoside-diphosphate-sugar epimerase|uniref:NAD(P)-dependent oxidoreductase n=1 Tax=Reinekea sp. TaxID=1970455 RepID=UPI0039892A70